MESSGAVALFSRSKEKLGLLYKTYIGDGDSKSYTAVCQSQPYGAIFIDKEECTSNITKRVGTGLRELTRTNKGRVNYFTTFISAKTNIPDFRDFSSLSRPKKIEFKYSQRPLIRRPIIRTFPNSNGFFPPSYYFLLKSIR